MHWQLQEAKQKLSEVIEKALQEGPQVVTRRGDGALLAAHAAPGQDAA